MYVLTIVIIIVFGFSKVISTDGILSKLTVLFITITVLFVVYKIEDRKVTRLMREKESERRRLEEIVAIEAETARLQSDFIAGPFAAKKIGGSGYEIVKGQNLSIGITRNSLIFIEKSIGPRRVEIGFDEINEIEISGPGKVISNAGVVGGGFGLEGFLQGAAAAAIINAATTRSSINTFVRVLSTTGEIYLHSSSVEPLQLKMQLSPIFVKLSNQSRITNSSSSRNIASELEKIQELFQSGTLSQSEFETAKRKILS
jgi:hypothetical protein